MLLRWIVLTYFEKLKLCLGVEWNLKVLLEWKLILHMVSDYIVADTRGARNVNPQNRGFA